MCVCVCACVCVCMLYIYDYLPNTPKTTGNTVSTNGTTTVDNGKYHAEKAFADIKIFFSHFSLMRWITELYGSIFKDYNFNFK